MRSELRLPCTIAALDIGTPGKTVGWWRRPPAGPGSGGTQLKTLIARMAAELKAGNGVALGFEAPLFLPLPNSEYDLVQPRRGEGSRFWYSGHGGAYVTAVGVQETAFVLRRIADRLHPPPAAGVRWSDFEAGKIQLWLWEAFVSGTGKGKHRYPAMDEHTADARVAVEELLGRLAEPPPRTDVYPCGEVISLVGAAILASGLVTDARAISQPTTVIKT